MVSLFFNSYINRFLLEGQMVEVIWTPLIILVFIAFLTIHFFYLTLLSDKRSAFGNRRICQQFSHSTHPNFHESQTTKKSLLLVHKSYFLSDIIFSLIISHTLN